MTGLRERKKTERREDILACSEKLFRTHGFDATTMETIAARADISPATLYNFFPTKLDILTELYGRRIDESVAAFRSSAGRPHTDPVEAVHALATAMFDTYAGFDRGLLRRVTLNALNEGPGRGAGARFVLADSVTLQEVVSVLRRCQMEGSLASHLPIKDLAAAIFASGSGEYYTWLGDDASRMKTVLANVRRHIEIILGAAMAPRHSAGRASTKTRSSKTGKNR